MSQISLSSLSSQAHEGSAGTLVLIDGHSLAYRMYFALERTNMRTSDGTPTWAVYGFFNALFALLKKVQPTAMAVSFDLGRITFRNDLYPEYKAHREAMPDEMRAQMGLVREGVERLGIPIFELPHYEADDVIGTLATQAAQVGYGVQILTGDQDAFQLVEDAVPASQGQTGRIEVLIPPRMPRDEMKTYDRAAVFAKWGVYPEQVIDFKGLKGDTSDNIPGVPGVGDKTAVKLLSEYQNLDRLYASLDELPANKLKEKLVAYRDQAFLSRQLATIDRQAPLPPVCWSDCHLSIPDEAALRVFLERMEFRSMLKQAATVFAPFLPGDSPSVADTRPDPVRATSNDEPVSEVAAKPGSVLTAPWEGASVAAVPHTIVTTHRQLTELMDRIRQVGVFALDLETTGLDVHTAQLAGIAISVGRDLARVERPAQNILGLSEYPAHFYALAQTETDRSILDTDEHVYIPIRYADQGDSPGELQEADVLAALGPILADERIVQIVHNAKFELNVFRQHGLPVRGLVFDTMIASYVDHPDRRHGLKSLSQELLGQPMREITDLIGTGKKQVTFDQVSLVDAAAYAAHDTYATLSLARYFLSRLSETQWTLFYEVEMPLAQVLADIEWTGVALDTAYLKGLSDTLGTRLETLERDIWALAGVTFNLNSPKQVGEVLFERMGLTPPRKTKGKTGWSTDVKVLEQLAQSEPIAVALLEYRQLFKLKSTYIDALPALIHPKTGRVHTSFNQTVTATGRLSSSHPNLQNIPIRTELGRQIRQAFVPGHQPDWHLLSADYSQIELRLLAHFSQDPHLVSAFQAGEDIHTATAALVFGMSKDKVTKEQRYRAKTVNFGVIYGQSPYGLAQQLKIPQAEAAQFIQLYFSRYGQVRRYIDEIKAQAHATGKVETLAGRQRDLSVDLQSSNRSVREFAERAAFNTPLQGSAADLMKIAMIRLHRRLEADGLQSKIILQVHDELVLEVPEAELESVQALVRWAMALDQPLRVPLVIDEYVGPTWME